MRYCIEARGVVSKMLPRNDVMQTAPSTQKDTERRGGGGGETRGTIIVVFMPTKGDLLASLFYKSNGPILTTYDA